ncbi:MAG: type II toxin-antitoxin system Phd/YefM family antitoxin [Nitrospirae bacterium]|nr:MAG: type II toxin-antitoxin system Phd/YefM family antitoxin [Nitrospirota bacterium]
MYMYAYTFIKEVPMKATIVDLRYKMNDILKALERNEAVTVLYHGKVKGIITPAKRQVLKKIKDHPFFGMSAKGIQKSVLDELHELRKSRYHDI